jgi:membrane protease YdiL (CAAX protease family)
MSYNIDSRPGVTYSATFFLLFGLLGAGFLVGGAAAIGVWSAMTGKAVLSMEKDMADPANVQAVRMVQLVSTFFIFFLPAYFTALIANRKPLKLLGFNNHFDMRTVGLVILIMLVSLPLVGALTELNSLIKLPAAYEKIFKDLEEAYEKQVTIMSRMTGFGDYLVALVVMALGPAIFEETFFRGGMQNILQKWTGRTWTAIIITSLVFSAIHFSWYGFLARFALGMVLGLLYHYSGSLWLSIAGHFLNNGLVVTIMYYMSRKGVPMDDIMHDTDPIWIGAIALVAMYCLFLYYRKFSEQARLKKMPPEERALAEQWLA